jgi:hypothetical protein
VSTTKVRTRAQCRQLDCGGHTAYTESNCALETKTLLDPVPLAAQLQLTVTGVLAGVLYPGGGARPELHQD